MRASSKEGSYYIGESTFTHTEVILSLYEVVQYNTDTPGLG